MALDFNFFHHWYPILPVQDFRKDQPTAVTILGVRLVIWKPRSSDTYRVFLDECPHRLAPLSEGRIDEKTGNLACKYHGWEFDSQGICTHIPQAENIQLIAKNRQGFCAHALPCRQEYDLLWVWLDTNSAQQAATTPLPLSPKQIHGRTDFVWSSYARELEYDWQTLVENLTDPSHLPFAHHQVIANREQARPISIKIEQSTQNLIEATAEDNFTTTITFEPPCRLEYSLSLDNGEKQTGVLIYCVPISPGKSRFIVQFNRNFAKPLYYITPRWWEHIKVHCKTLDGDMIMLHQQEHFLQRKKLVKTWKTAYKLPTSADHLVIEFRNWFDKYCNSQLPWSEVGISVPENPKINDNREELLDHYKQHTQYCSSCQGLFKTLQRIQWVVLGYSIIAVSVAVILPDDLRVQVGLPLILLALLGLGFYGLLKLWVSPKYYFVDYILQLPFIQPSIGDTSK